MTNNMAVVRRWGEQWGYIGRGGVIVLFDGEVQSWVNQLRNPEHWQLGCIAFDEEGKSVMALCCRCRAIQFRIKGNRPAALTAAHDAARCNEKASAELVNEEFSAFAPGTGP